VRGFVRGVWPNLIPRRTRRLSFLKRALCLLLASPLIAAVIAAGCSDSPSTASTGGSGTTQSSSSGDTGGTGLSGGSGSASGGTGGVGGNTGSSSGTAGGGGAGVPVIVQCQGKVYQCGDLIDNDNDGLIDSQDPDCLGPCDNSEDGLKLDIPGGDGPGCYVDCYWDGNSGAGNDGCYWNHSCDKLSPEGALCPYSANANTPGTPLSCDELLNKQPQTCLEYCPQLVPNGCDCFGCCYIYKGGTQYGPVWLGTIDANKVYTCELDKVDDPTKCAPCTQVKNECVNDCGKCELCLGKTVDDLPPECFGQPPPPDAGPDGSPPPDAGDSGSPPPPPPQCPTGVQPCGLPGQALCEVGWSCITGCCVQNPK